MPRAHNRALLAHAFGKLQGVLHQCVAGSVHRPTGTNQPANTGHRGQTIRINMPDKGIRPQSGAAAGAGDIRPMHPRCVLHQLHSSTHLLCSWIIWFLFRRLLRRRILSSTDHQTLRRHNIHRRAVVPHALFHTTHKKDRDFIKAVNHDKQDHLGNDIRRCDNRR